MSFRLLCRRVLSYVLCLHQRIQFCGNRNKNKYRYVIYGRYGWRHIFHFVTVEVVAHGEYRTDTGILYTVAGTGTVPWHRASTYYFRHRYLRPTGLP
jgi:hypothetical protein